MDHEPENRGQRMRRLAVGSRSRAVLIILLTCVLLIAGVCGLIVVMNG